jgi:DNA-directed RNA polymerase specialized sigma24 family protein
MRTFHPAHLAKVAVALLITTAGSTYMQLLLMSSTNPETAARASEDLMAALRPRVATLVAEWCVTQDVQPIVQAPLVDAAMRYIRDAVWQCRSRSPQDFTTWVARRVTEWLDSDCESRRDNVGIEHGPCVPRRPAEGGSLLGAAPRAERAAVLYATMQRLTPAERRILELRQRPRATWETVARALGVSVRTATTRHAEALDRAQMVVLDVLAERLDDTLDASVALRDDGEMHDAA